MDGRPDELTGQLRAAQDGDRRALAAFIRATQADVWRLTAHLVSPDEADDLTQEVFLRMWRSLPQYRGDAGARAWLLGIARNTCVDAVRGLMRRRRHARTVRRTDDAPDPSGGIVLRDLLAGLKPSRREAFVLTQLLGLSYAEAATACGCEIGTIRSRVARARSDLITDVGAAESR